MTDGIAAAYRDGRDRIAAGNGVRDVLTTTCNLRNATPLLFAFPARIGLPTMRYQKKSSARSA